MRRAAISLVSGVVIVLVTGLLWLGKGDQTTTPSALRGSSDGATMIDGSELEDALDEPLGPLPAGGALKSITDGQGSLTISSLPAVADPNSPPTEAVISNPLATISNSINSPFNNPNPAPPNPTGSIEEVSRGRGDFFAPAGGTGNGNAALARRGGSPSGDGISGDGSRGGQLRALGGSRAVSGRGIVGALRGSHAAIPAASTPSITTWKRSHLIPNTSRLMVGDKESLPLRGMQVDARIDGFRARVVLDCFYENTEAQVREGSFQLRLPNGASPYYFAFGDTLYQVPPPQERPRFFLSAGVVHKFGTSPDDLLKLRTEQWNHPRVARVVQKEKAAYAYNETIRRRVDPALVEWAGAGVFQSRVFPLQPGKLHRIVVGYDVDLLPVEDDLEFRLDLPDIKIPCVVDVSVASPGSAKVDIQPPAELQADAGRANFRFDNFDGREIVVRTTPPGPVLLTGSDEATGPYFATRLRPTLPPTKRAALSPRGVFLLDTSLSSSPQLFNIWLKLLEAILTNNRESLREFAVLFFNVEDHWWQEKFVANTPENVAALLEHAKTLSLEGATDLRQALADAAKPAWLGKDDAGGRHSVFLLSDGAATWGESNPAALAKAMRSGAAGPLFAYATGLSGSDPQMMALLTRESGGAVFSVAGDAEVAAASMAHHTQPWELVGIQIDGGSDVLVAGRPAMLFAGQSLLIVGRGKPTAASHVNLTLRQDGDQQVVKTALAVEIDSQLAPRTYGQVAVDQLEELPGDATENAAATNDTEQIATAYARQFRVTGRTCSLLMLETEEDYRRYGIKPELDQVVVKQKPAAEIVKRSAKQPDVAAAGPMSDGKAQFLAWLAKMEKSPGVKFEVTLPLRLALQGLPASAFEVQAPRLVCKGRTPSGQPAQFQEQLASREAEYDVVAAEAERRFKLLGPHDALRALSSLIEQSPGDVVLARDVAFSAMEWQLGGHAYYLLERVAASRPFEPQTYHALARCLEDLGNTDLALAYYEVCLAGQWDDRYREFNRIVSFDYLRLLRAIASGQRKTAVADYAAARLKSLAEQADAKCDLVVIIAWNTDQTDVDLHVQDPGGEICYYGNRHTRQGGNITQDVTQGYGPEMFTLPQAARGRYDVRVHYFANNSSRASARTKVYATIYQGWGTPQEKVLRKTVVLEQGKEDHAIAAIRVE